MVSMPEWLLVVQIMSFDPEIEDELNRWYDEVHLPEIVQCPGFIRGSRYVSAESRYGPAGHYFAIYELSGPDALSTAEFLSRRGWSEFEGRLTASIHVLHARRVD